MSIASGEVNLERYRCAKCGQTPKISAQLFTGCSCGHRLFRLSMKQEKAQPPSEEESEASKPKNMGFLTIRERKIGVYDINVEKLLDIKPKKDAAVIAGNNGVYSIRIQSPKKKND
jgi:predicted  nucleic acid-binding Zn-ribbon protein